MIKIPFDCCRCTGTDCSVKDTCLRYRNRNHIGPRTPFFVEPPGKDQQCQYYWKPSDY